MSKGERIEATVVLYAVDLHDLTRWIGCKDEQRFRDAWKLVREEDDSDWEPAELEVLERLLRRLVFEGQLYEGLPEPERYYLTQLLIDLFDEYAEPDALSEDLPLDRLLQALETLPKGGTAARLASWLVRGRELQGERWLWEKGPVAESLSYLGYLTREETGPFAEALQAALRQMRTRPSGLLKQLQSAAEECARAEMELVSFVG